jgi:hypothetical protein
MQLELDFVSVGCPYPPQDCFIVRDANGQALAYVYFEDEPGRRSAASVPHALVAGEEMCVTPWLGARAIIHVGA